MTPCRSTAIVLLACTAAACASLDPIPVSAPAARLEKDAPTGRIPDATNFDELVLNLRSYEKTYRDKAEALRKSEYAASNVGLLGGLVAIFGALDHSRSTFNAGALTGGAAVGVSQRYQVGVQAQNYETARRSVHCMLGKAQEFPVSPDAFHFDQDPALDARRSLLYVAGNKHLADVAERLRAAQWSVSLLAPDVSRLRDLSEKYGAIATPTPRGQAKAQPTAASDAIRPAMRGLPANADASRRSTAADAWLKANTPLLTELVTRFEGVMATCAAAGT